MDRFFSSQNIIDNLSDDELSGPFDYRETIYAFARTTYSSLYVIDYAKKAFEYVSENPLFLCGLKTEEVKEMGYSFYFKYVTEEDLELLIKINKIGFDFFDTIPINERKLYTISYDFHLKSDRNKKILVNQKLTPIYLSNSGKIWKALCVVSLSPEKSAGNVKIFKKGDSRFFHYNLLANVWESSESIILSEREREVLQLSIRGFTISEIAQELFISPETVKFHRKKMFDKMGVNHIAEAIFYAANNKLL